LFHCTSTFPLRLPISAVSRNRGRSWNILPVYMGEHLYNKIQYLSLFTRSKNIQFNIYEYNPQANFN
jgi:hypothetical protein